MRSLPLGTHADGGGVWFWKREDGGGQWVLRVSIHGRRGEMVLGSLSEVSLNEAHQVAGEQRQLVCQNKNQTKGIVLAYS